MSYTQRSPRENKKENTRMCGVIGISGTEHAAELSAVGTHAEQHRGQEACGIISFEGDNFHEHRAAGLVGSVFNKATLARLKGTTAIGHVRYSTSGAKNEDAMLQARDAQPLVSVFSFGPLAIAHNGNLTNAKRLRQELEMAGHSFQTRSADDEVVDTEVALKLIGNSVGAKFVDRLKAALSLLEGGYAFVMATKKKLIGACDPFGIRPLVIGRRGDGSYVFASETCALKAVGARFERDVMPGEIAIVEEGVLSSHRFAEKRPSRNCIFEYIYFARPDSRVWNRNTYFLRKAQGCELAREAPAEADIVVAIPDSGNPAALGYSNESRIPFEFGLVRSHYVGRAFIQKTQDERELAVILKHFVNDEVVKGQRLVVSDDSLVRGTTAKRIVERLWEADAREVHLRIASPPWRHGCPYGIDETDPARRIAKPKEDVRDVCEFVRKITGATSVAYLSIDGMYRAVFGEARNNACPQACDACFTGDFPTPLTDLFNGYRH